MDVWEHGRCVMIKYGYGMLSILQRPILRAKRWVLFSSSHELRLCRFCIHGHTTSRKWKLFWSTHAFLKELLKKYMDDRGIQYNFFCSVRCIYNKIGIFFPSWYRHGRSFYAPLPDGDLYEKTHLRFTRILRARRHSLFAYGPNSNINNATAPIKYPRCF